MIIPAESIFPTQTFLKPDTIRFIFNCLNDGLLDQLPPTPITRADEHGDLITIDGHNIIAVRAFRREQIEVAVASSPDHLVDQKLSEISSDRRRMLAQRFDIVMRARQQTVDQGINTFYDLTAKYPELFI